MILFHPSLALYLSKSRGVPGNVHFALLLLFVSLSPKLC